MASQGGGRYQKVCVVSGHHIYKCIWTLVIIEQLVLETQDRNKYDDHAVAEMKDDGYVVRHIFHSISSVSCFFFYGGIGYMQWYTPHVHVHPCAKDVTPSVGTPASI